MKVRRALGLTCLSALEAATDLGKPAKNNGKGCGAIMRVAPVALMLPQDLVRDAAVACSALTHGHNTSQLAAAASQIDRPHFTSAGPHRRVRPIADDQQLHSAVWRRSRKPPPRRRAAKRARAWSSSHVSHTTQQVMLYKPAN